MIKRAVVVGAGGQDGTLLSRLLEAHGAEVLRVSRFETTTPSGAPCPPLDIRDPEAVRRATAEFGPDAVYYLAARHHASEDAGDAHAIQAWKDNLEINVQSAVHFLEALRLEAPKTRFFYPASSLVFGEPGVFRATEDTPLEPRCIYGVSKVAGVHACRLFREKYGVFASVGYLFNHESALRPERFVSQKIVMAATRIARGQQKELVLGNLAARVDWGYAPDFVDAMRRITELPAPDDFIVATGELHTVGDWAALAFKAVGLPHEPYVRETPGLLTRRKPPLFGDASKLSQATGWRPTTSFPDMVAAMVAAAQKELA